MLAGGLGSQLVEFVGGVESHRRELSQRRGVELDVVAVALACRSTALLASCQPHRVTSTPAVARRVPRTCRGLPDVGTPRAPPDAWPLGSG